MNDLNNPEKKVGQYLIWDSDGSPPKCAHKTILWRMYSDDEDLGVISIPSIVDLRGDSLRSRYLAWIYELSQTKVSGASISDQLEIRPGFSFWWMTLLQEKCNFAKSPLIEDAIRLMAFDEISKELGIKNIKIFSGNKKLIECARLWCERAGGTFEVCFIPRAYKTFDYKRYLYNRLPSILQVFIWLSYYVFTRLPLIKINVKDWQNSEGKKTFISYFFNLVEPENENSISFQSKYWTDLPKFLSSQQERSNWLHLYIRSKEIPNAKAAVEYLKNFNESTELETHVFLDSFLGPKSIICAIKDWLTISKKSKRLGSCLAKVTSKDLILWPLFSEDWITSTKGRGLMSGCIFINLFEIAFDKLPIQQSGFYLQENMAWEMALIHAWRSAGHQMIFGYPHATVRFWDLRYFSDPRSYGSAEKCNLALPDRVLVNGREAMRQYLKGGYPRSKIRIVEALRYLYLSDIFNEDKQLNEQKDSLILLVLGDFLENCTHVQMRMLSEALKFLKFDPMVIIKPHPACNINFKEYDNFRHEISNLQMQELLPKVDVAFTSSQTSAAVDAYCSGVPVISVLMSENLNLSPLRGVKDVNFVRTPVELVSALEYIQAHRRNPKIDNTFFCLDQSLVRWKKILSIENKNLKKKKLSQKEINKD